MASIFSGQQQGGIFAHPAQQQQQQLQQQLPGANQQKVEAEWKLVLVGDGGVGKTTLVLRHLTGTSDKLIVYTVNGN